MLNITMREDMGAFLHKGLSEWWSEESAYLIQRIERWAAFARGYNRLRSVRLSRARMTMQTGTINEDYYWLSTSPNIYSLKRTRSPDETRSINCCGTFNYQSNSHFNSTCLETYRYDHSIYFKTIGDIKNSKRKLRNDDDDDEDIQCCQENKNNHKQCQYCSCCNNNQVELNERVNSESSDRPEDSNNTKINVVTPNVDVRLDYFYNNNIKQSTQADTESMLNDVWPIVELTMLNENILDQRTNQQDEFYDENIYNNDADDNNNNRNNNNYNCDISNNVQYQNGSLLSSCGKER